MIPLSRVNPKTYQDSPRTRWDDPELSPSVSVED